MGGEDCKGTQDEICGRRRVGSSRTRVASIVGEARVLKREAQHGGLAWQEPCDRGAHPSIFWHPARAVHSGRTASHAFPKCNLLPTWGAPRELAKSEDPPPVLTRCPIVWPSVSMISYLARHCDRWRQIWAKRANRSMTQTTCNSTHFGGFRRIQAPTQLRRSAYAKLHLTR